jgi:FkbH-like protein
MLRPIKHRLRTGFVALCAAVISRAKQPQALLAAIGAQVRERHEPPDAFVALRVRHNGPAYFAPDDLARTATAIRRVLVIGSCLAQDWIAEIEAPCDFVLANNLSALPDRPPQAPGDYDLQIVQLPLRGSLYDGLIWGIAHGDLAAHEAAFATAVERMRAYLETACGWNRRFGVLTFVTNFLVPQQSPMGRLQPRYDLRNPLYFVERLNAVLEAELARYDDAYLIDIDAIAAAYGRRFLQDDAINAVGHGSLWDHDPHVALDAQRIEPFPELAEHYDFADRRKFYAAAWKQIVAMVRTLRRTDEVKLVVVDLDDTLWRGVLAEDPDLGNERIEGWPVGVIEALAYLKKRGVLLAIVSKNERERIEASWDGLMRGRLRLDDFAVREINWRSKAENVAAVLAAVNVLPESVLFVDDNPAERAAVESAFPGIRTLGAYPLYLRRTLLWSPETQVATVTGESERRTELIQTQVRRETERATFSREDFLKSLELEVEIFDVAGRHDARFDRVLELINKTNQFNTTGRRRRADEFAVGNTPRLIGFRARDRFSDYGIIGAVVLAANRIEQFVMSCRVFGLDVENVVLDHMLAEARAAGATEMTAALEETPANQPCRDLFARNGFTANATGWVRPIVV